MKILLLLVILDLSLPVRATGAAHPAEVTNAVPLTPEHLKPLFAEMQANHPALQSAGHRVRAAGLNTNAVRVWEDPMLRFGGVTTSRRGSRLSEDGDLVYALEQKLPLFGRAEAVRRVATAEAGVEEARLAGQIQILRRDLAAALFKAALAGRVVQLAAQDLAWIETMVATTGERYRAGAATQVELLRVQNERSRRADQFKTESARRDHELVTVNRLLGRPFQAALPAFDLPPSAEAVPFSQRLVEHALAHEPRLATLRGERSRAAASVQVTRKARLPEVSAGIEGRQYSGDGGFREGMFSVSLSLPWLNRSSYRSELAREEARLKAVESDTADQQLTLGEEIHHLVVSADAARREALLQRDEILPRSNQALESAHAGWLAGRGMVRDLMEARRALLDAQLMEARAIADQHILLAELVLRCGFEDLDALFRMVRQTASPESKP